MSLKITPDDPTYSAQVGTGVVAGSSLSGDASGPIPGPITVTAINGIAITGAPSAAGDEIIATSTTAAHWATPAATLTNPMTAVGDIIVGGTVTGGVAAPARLGIGSSTQLLHGGTTPGYSAVVEADLSLSAVTTADVSTSKHGFAPTLPNDATKYLDGTGAYTVPAGSGGGALVAHPMPLDSYAIDGTYGDDFTGASLSGSWTRRNYTSGAETYQVGKGATYLRIAQTGRAAGDGYFRTAPAGDWTFAMAFIARGFASGTPAWGIAVVDTNGTGVSTCQYSSPAAGLVIATTTYSTYGGTFQQVREPPLPYWGNERKFWVYLRKSGTNYYTAVSYDGEVWCVESPAQVWAGTVDRIAMMDAPLGTVNVSNTYVDVDWFNKIA